VDETEGLVKEKRGKGEEGGKRGNRNEIRGNSLLIVGGKA